MSTAGFCEPGELQAVRGAVSLNLVLCTVRSHYNAVQLWQKSAGAGTCTAEPKAAAAGDACGSRDDADLELSQRLLRLPGSLPPAVVEQLDRISSTYSEEMLTVQLQAEGDSNGEGKVQLLQKVLGVSELLLVEVLCTLGCSNPECVDLSGSSEVKVSLKTCSACKVVCYCSKECHNAHWERHKILCKKLRAGPRSCGRVLQAVHESSSSMIVA